MSRYKAYPEYKETRHSWLENIPAHWKMLPLKFLTAQHVTDGPHETPEFIDEGVPFLSVDGIQNNQLVFEGCRYISREDHERYSIKCRPNTGDVLLGKAASVGKVAHVDTDIEFNVWSPLAVIKPRTKKAGRFIYYSLQSALLQMQCDMYSNANTQKNLGMSTIDNLAFASPTDDEAEQIAYFLDHETAKIDALIEKQQRLIELLKEKRQAVISHAVTKGLNPNAPAKDSGVEWLGEVPAHWAVKKFSHCTIIKSGQVDPTKLPYSEFTLIAPNHIESGTGKIIDLEAAEAQGADSGKYLCRKGEVIYSKIRPNLAKVCLSPSDKTICSADMYPISGINGLSNKFLYWSLLSNWFTSFVILESDRVAMPKINREKLAEVFLPIPPENEQVELAVWLENKTAIVDALLEKAKSGIELLQERRTALISAAVTGKIDVRDWQAAA